MILSKLAWFGPVSAGGGVPGMGLCLLNGLLSRGVGVDVYTSQSPDDIAQLVSHRQNLNVVQAPVEWQWNRWYSRNRMLAFLTGTMARARSYKKLCHELLARQSNRRYDCVFQLSQSELFDLSRKLSHLPPVVVYPCVHAAGELLWHKRESKYALESESAVRHYAARVALSYRTRRQQHDLRLPDLVIGMSRRFNELIAAHYGIREERQAILYHPIPEPAKVRDVDLPNRRKRRLLYIARLSVRKGLQHVVELSHRLDDLHDRVEIVVAGGPSLWSDYSGHLGRLNPRIASYVGDINHSEIGKLYGSADALVLPSLYEPGGIVVGEALSYGLPVVVSDEVGSGEEVSDRCCRMFPAGNDDVFEMRVRELLVDLDHSSHELSSIAIQERKRLFCPDKISQELLSFLSEVSGRRKAVNETCTLH